MQCPTAPKNNERAADLVRRELRLNLEPLRQEVDLAEILLARAARVRARGVDLCTKY